MIWYDIETNGDASGLIVYVYNGSELEILERLQEMISYLSYDELWCEVIIDSCHNEPLNCWFHALFEREGNIVLK